MNRDEKFKKDMERQAETKRDHMKIMAKIARQVYELSKIRDRVKSKICKATTFLEENKDNDDLDVQKALEAEYDSLKNMQEAELKVEMALAGLRKLRGERIEMLKMMRNLEIAMRRDYLNDLNQIMNLTRSLMEQKRNDRQEQIMSEIENDPLPKVAEDECTEILKSRLNVD